MRRGSLIGARWHWVGGPGKDARAAVVVAPGAFDLAAHGVSNVVPLGHAERGFAGMPHDGMRVLAELVEWTNG